jgi:hypothetical protein
MVPHYSQIQINEPRFLSKETGYELEDRGSNPDRVFSFRYSITGVDLAFYRVGIGDSYIDGDAVLA